MQLGPFRLVTGRGQLPRVRDQRADGQSKLLRRPAPGWIPNHLGARAGREPRLGTHRGRTVATPACLATSVYLCIPRDPRCSRSLR